MLISLPLSASSPVFHSHTLFPLFTFVSLYSYSPPSRDLSFTLYFGFSLYFSPSLDYLLSHSLSICISVPLFIFPFIILLFPSFAFVFLPLFYCLFSHVSNFLALPFFLSLSHSLFPLRFPSIFHQHPHPTSPPLNPMHLIQPFPPFLPSPLAPTPH